MPPTIRSKRKGSASAGPKRVRRPAKQVADEEQEILGMLPDPLAQTYVKSRMSSAEDQLARQGLKAPSEYEGEWPELPDDIDATDYSELSNLLLQFQNALSTAVWQQSFHYIWSGTFEEIMDYMEARALLSAEQSNEPKRKAEARTDDRVVFFRAKHKEHYNSYVRFRDLARTIEGKIKAVSRVLGFKDDDEEATNLSAVKKRGTNRRSRNK